MSKYYYLHVQVVLEVEADDEEEAIYYVHKCLQRLPEDIRVVKHTESVKPAPEYAIDFEESA